jgi:aspartyl-tRNA(Asn)/glutamyl-tRNA(Gln) amidotransferase subunit B
VYFEAVAAVARPDAAAQWVRGELARRVNDGDASWTAMPVAPGDLARLITMVDDGVVSMTAAKQVLSRMACGDGTPEVLVASMGLALESDAAVVRGWVDEVLASRPDAVAQHRDGRRGVSGFLVGLVMKLSGGRANPRVVDRVLRERLERGMDA